MVKLQVRIHSGSGLPKYCRLFDKTDPYVVVKLGPTAKRTSTKWSAGENATFEEDLVFEYHGEELVSVNVYDEERFAHDYFIGSGSFNLKECKEGCWHGDINIRSQANKFRGRIKITIEFLQRVTSSLGSQDSPSSCSRQLDTRSLFSEHSIVPGESHIWKEQRSLRPEDFSGLSPSASDSTSSSLLRLSDSQPPADLIVLTGSALHNSVTQPM
eukprot:Blabericola_migrator_1__5904@NODE_298_length_10203_cov_353_110695_g245_i0_p6_GENE_NODE_298_length_10203_cov_353_110695_g245_i0NODE_298_length_10203_cov_353_110695_g245_i0_p6_ORF_typecomplete_len214_score31_55C2/PF00168_30/5_4e15_NODE_298_length_10203_cov_353_110695_g245_i075208161